ncbi:MAG: hypothetical protein GWM90_24490, partial [Gemmatimonadetes bacterium]|nr:hypothetical protein [Gemmatimonadota bacterium]NIQ57938.1 hypothetical protein [Gemmatimonadota bacterium]NIU78114.1 hypothetical protein [Gammaproteobacteria bacterium]NIX41511.1 hypothetical protein [Gemmatimonadota bacterium]NIX47120.1 hypothetical protein [Gemmatimonadota bacterium]
MPDWFCARRGAWPMRCGCGGRRSACGGSGPGSGPWSVRCAGRPPGFAVPVLSTLAVGIGACTAIFSVAHAVLYRPLPFPDPERLAVVWGEARTTGASRLAVDAPDAALIRDRAGAFDGVAFVRTGTDGTLTGARDAEPIAVARVTDDYFDVLGTAPQLGR